MWCVEGVIAGEMNVTRYDLVDEVDDRYRFTKVEQVRAGIGSSGALIPPYEYHVLGNALPRLRRLLVGPVADSDPEAVVTARRFDSEVAGLRRGELLHPLRGRGVSGVPARAHAAEDHRDVRRHHRRNHG